MTAVRDLFEEHVGLVFHFRTVQVALEERFSESTIRRALRALVSLGELVTEEFPQEEHVASSDVFDFESAADVRPLHDRSEARLIWHPELTGFERARESALRLIELTSQNGFGLALGDHAEHLVVTALGQIGGRLESGDGRSFRGLRAVTNLSLDAIFSNERGAWGFEIKNQLVSPPPAEVRKKLILCRELGLKFVLVARYVTPALRTELLSEGTEIVTFRNWQIPRSLLELSDALGAHAYPVCCQKDPDAEFRQELSNAMESAMSLRGAGAWLAA